MPLLRAAPSALLSALFAMIRHRFAALAVLVTVLLFQWTWAAAAGLCRHDGHQTPHFGHHSHLASSHVPEAHATGQAPDDKGASLLPGADCGCCHAWVAAPLWELHAPHAPMTAPGDFSEPPPRYDSAAEPRPERPRWRA